MRSALYCSFSSDVGGWYHQPVTNFSPSLTKSVYKNMLLVSIAVKIEVGAEIDALYRLFARSAFPFVGEENPNSFGDLAIFTKGI